jgi:hypothetical protein
MKLNITRKWLLAQLAEMDAAGVDEFADAGVPGAVMVCKLQLHSANPMKGFSATNQELPGQTVHFGAVWEGSTEKQQASENAIFGHWTPYAEFKGSILNPHVNEQLKVGAKYYVTFVQAPD